MRVSRRALAVVLAFAANICFSQVASVPQSDQVVAERVLGAQWKQLCRRAGMIFAGTVLSATRQVEQGDRSVQGATPAVELNFRVDAAIAGVDPGQTLKIREWAGAWAMHRPMRTGERVLIFLYPLSRLDLTSPVGGSMGQIELDASGKNVLGDVPRNVLHYEQHKQNSRAPVVPSHVSAQSRQSRDVGSVSIFQLERAIRSAREE